MNDLGELCKRVVAIGQSTGHATNYAEFALECVLNMEEMAWRIEELKADREAEE